MGDLVLRGLSGSRLCVNEAAIGQATVRVTIERNSRTVPLFPVVIRLGHFPRTATRANDGEASRRKFMLLERRPQASVGNLPRV